MKRRATSRALVIKCMARSASHRNISSIDSRGGSSRGGAKSSGRRRSGIGGLGELDSGGAEPVVVVDRRIRSLNHAA